MRICIFCSANGRIDPDFFAATEELGRWAAENGHTIVYGGVNMGLMEHVAKAAMEAERPSQQEKQVRTVGVVPHIVEQQGRASQYNEVEICCENLNERKQLMEEQSDAFIALPGGIGTLDEIFTVAAAATIGYHSKPLVLYNMKGFWNPLTTLLDDLQQQGLMRGSWKDYIHVANSLEDIKHILKL